VKLLAALSSARLHDAGRAKALLDQLEKSESSNTALKVYWFPVIRAALEMSSNNPSQAIIDLEAAAPYELGSPLPLSVGSLYPAYVRGEAYLAQHDGPAAAREFQKFIDHAGVVQNFPPGALARLGLGRAYAMAGDTAKAKTAYQEFLNLWKDADPDIPILKEAKEEYARLQ